MSRSREPADWPQGVWPLAAVGDGAVVTGAVVTGAVVTGAVVTGVVDGPPWWWAPIRSVRPMCSDQMTGSLHLATSLTTRVLTKSPREWADSLFRSASTRLIRPGACWEYSRRLQCLVPSPPRGRSPMTGTPSEVLS